MRENIYSDNYAMTYEYLIRRAHQCGRYGVAGADADIYRRFLQQALIYKTEREAIENNKPRQWRQSEEDMLKDYMKSTGEISAFIQTATHEVKQKFEDKLTDEQYNKLEEVEVKLLNANIENITKAIEIASEVMLEIKLYPG